MPRTRPSSESSAEPSTEHWTREEIDRRLASFEGARDESPAKARRRRKILEVASELFIHHGYRKTSVDDIAREAGIAKGTVYLYFPTKADLLVHALVDEKRRYVERLEPVFEEGLAPRERLRRWFRLVLEVGAEMPLTSRLMSGDHEVTLVLDEMDTDLRQQAEEQQLEMVAELLDAAAMPHDWTRDELLDRAKTLTAALYGGMMTDERTRRGLSTQRFAALFADLVVDGIGASKGRSK